MSLTQRSKTDNVIFYTGLVLMVLAFGLFLFFRKTADFFVRDLFDSDAYFLINYAISVGYFFTICIHQFGRYRFKFSLMDKRHYLVALLLFAISAFTLNLSIPVFERFATWTEVYLFVMFMPLLAICFWDKMHALARALLLFVMGAGTILTLYFAFFLIPLYPIGMVGVVALGLSLHVFAPLIIVITFIFQFAKIQETKQDTLAYLAGIGIPLLILGGFLLQWKSTDSLIRQAHVEVLTRSENTLPQWVLLSQKLPGDPFTQKIMEGDLKYTSPRQHFSWFDIPTSTLQEVREHDPLVFCAYLLMGDLPVSQDTRLKILESKYDARHLTQRKLWSGRDLSTAFVENKIEVFPQYRLAYTEKIIQIHNNHEGRWSQEEAAYTFYLPEGSVVTSLSLWIDGEEQKSRLTTKSKADSAYVAVVGVERRDPALLHWQEGNTVTVTVFPCSPKEDRIFKIGVTTPMQQRGDQLVLGNVYFDGPSAFFAREATKVLVNNPQQVTGLELPVVFLPHSRGEYRFSGPHRQYWEMSCDIPPIPEEGFSFNGNGYHLEALHATAQAVDFENIYLDLNKSWSKSEFEKIFALAGDRKVYVWEDRLLKVSQENKDDLFAHFDDYNFSLFPVEVISEPEKSLLISKSGRLSPSLEDLETTTFSSNLEAYFQQKKAPINLYSLNALSPYLQTLREFQAFNYCQGNEEKLKSLLEVGAFPQAPQDENIVNLNDAGVSIVRDSNATLAGAPDHLMRLFAYSQLMKKMGTAYFDQNGFVTDELIGIANEAYVVSPVSSLIVLETVKDYERFGIGENENSLGNATGQKGAVPEPHEWALLGLILLTLILMYRRKKTPSAATVEL